MPLGLAKDDSAHIEEIVRGNPAGGGCRHSIRLAGFALRFRDSAGVALCHLVNEEARSNSQSSSMVGSGQAHASSPVRVVALSPSARRRNCVRRSSDEWRGSRTSNYGMKQCTSRPTWTASECPIRTNSDSLSGSGSPEMPTAQSRTPRRPYGVVRRRYNEGREATRLRDAHRKGDWHIAVIYQK
jgi:hypothetical protein